MERSYRNLGYVLPILLPIFVAEMSWRRGMYVILCDRQGS